MEPLLLSLAAWAYISFGAGVASAVIPEDKKSLALALFAIAAHPLIIIALTGHRLTAFLNNG